MTDDERPTSLHTDGIDLAGGDALDVLVVGGGVGGSYAAWRLKTGELANGAFGLPPDPAARRIALIESSDRIGGRLESPAAPGAPELHAEFGGMGFTSHNTILTALVDTVFELRAEPFPRGGDDNLFYLRGERFTAKQLQDGYHVPYQLDPADRGKGPMTLIVEAIERVLPGATEFTAAEWRAVQEDTIFEGRHLRDIGLWNFLLMNMSSEAFAFAHDATGHFFEVSNWNCAQALPWLLGDGNASYRTLTDGYDQLPVTCAKRFIDAGGFLQIGLAAEGIAANADGTLRVSVGAAGAINARRVVLALPQRALEILAPSSIVLGDADLSAALGSVTGHRVMKIFLAYPYPWWNELGITDGSSSTDLPLGQCWYFSPVEGQGNTNSLLMASYNDTLATTYWEGLEGGEPFENPVGTGRFWAEQVPSALMVAEVQRQLREVHGDVTIPPPYAAAYRDWSVDPFGGAFSTWNVGVDADAVEARMLQPDPNVALHVVGSTYSSDQGWAEGALATAERLLTEHVGLARPPWLPTPNLRVPSEQRRGDP